MTQINEAASKYYAKPVRIESKYESFIVVENESGAVIAQGDDVPLEIVQLAEVQHCLDCMISEFESKNTRRGVPANFGMFSIRDIVVATGAEWLPGGESSDMYFVNHAKIPLANGKRLYLRQGDDPEDRECCVVDEWGFEPYVEDNPSHPGLRKP
jgi:hypothetical protein